MGQFRSTPCTKKHVEEGTTTRLTYCVTAMCGWRTYMEDAHIAKTDIGNGCSLFAVFDGHGGCEVAQIVSRIFIDTLTSNEEFKNKDYQKALAETYSIIDRTLRSPETEKELKAIREATIKKPPPSEQDSDSEEYDVGSTAVVCLITEASVIVANIGDSRCMASIGNFCSELSFDHKPDNQIQLNRIKRAGGQVIEGRVNGDINLSRAFGDFSFKSNTDLNQLEQQIISKPDIITLPLQGIDYLILGCDGIFEKRSNEEITSYVRQNAEKKSLREVSEQLLDSLISPKAEFMKGKDNMTLIIVNLSN